MFVILNNYSIMLNKLVTLFLLKNSHTGLPSYSATFCFFGFWIICFKLLISGVSFRGFKMSDFSGLDFGAALAAIGAFHVSNKHVYNLKNKDTDKNVN